MPKNWCGSKIQTGRRSKLQPVLLREQKLTLLKHANQFCLPLNYDVDSQP